jgi:transposase
VYIQRINTKQNGKIYPSIVLCRSYRENGKQKRQILATLTKWPKHVIEGLEKLIKGKTITSMDELLGEQGKSVGAIWMLTQLAQRVGIIKSLGQSRQGKLALLQILARCISQSSRLHISNYWAEHYAIEEVLKIKTPFTEDTLYTNLDWLSERQSKIEKSIFNHQYADTPMSDIYLYDVTSSYFEGHLNELAAYGYNRDKKSGKKQIVIGLLCNDQGDPVSVEVFKGNSSDLNTFAGQLEKLQDQFGVKRVVVVGDKGMIKTKQIDQINQLEWNYITSITKPQIRTLLKTGVIQFELFETQPIGIQQDGIRYILRRNPSRAEQTKANRLSRLQKIRQWVREENQRLIDHPKAQPTKSLQKMQAKVVSLKLHRILNIELTGRSLVIKEDETQMAEAALLDGCYVIKTELSKNVASDTTVHNRYKDLAKVEYAFRTLKTGLEQVRPIFLRKEKRTRAHVFICMLAYKLIHRMKSELADQMPLTLKESIKTMDQIHYTTYTYGEQKLKLLPTKYNAHQTQILQALKIKLPTRL